jgi:hypothetical protein
MSTDSMLSDFSQLDDANANASYASDAFSDTYSQSDYSGRDDVGMSNSSSYLDLSSLSRSASRLSHTSLQSTQSEASKNFKVVIRVRPPLPRELQTFGPKKFVNIVEVTEDERGIVLSENAGAGDETVNGVYTKHAFTFDHVYGENRGQRDVYEQTAKDAVLSTLQGYNATIIAYGQTGTGKTYTMEGVHSDEEQRGIIPRSIEEIFRCTLRFFLFLFTNFGIEFFFFLIQTFTTRHRPPFVFWCAPRICKFTMKLSLIC